MHPPVATTPEIDELLAADAPVAIGVSGGKDSSAVAFATIGHLNRIGHTGPRILVHSDLGVTEWKQSLEWCHKLADRLALELVVVRREKGDMMDRWEQRWSDNVARYESLKCVQLILPWSTPDMRFCTSEMKVAPICRNVSERFPGKTIVNVTGIRRSESTGRAKAPISKDEPKLKSVTRDTDGVTWSPIALWSLDETLSYLEMLNFPLHPAYLVWMLSRVSCVFCIMSNLADLRNAARCPENHDIFRRMVRLEIKSGFAFHGSQWLGDIASELLSDQEQEQLCAAKSKAEARRALESLIPRDLLYVKGWPVTIPTREAAGLLAGIRQQVSQIQGLNCGYTSQQSVIDRYEELWASKNGAAA